MKFEDLKIINVDDKPYIVDDLPPHIKILCERYDDWRKDLVNINNEQLKVEAAIQNIAQQIVLAIRAETSKVPSTPEVEQNTMEIENGDAEPIEKQDDN